MGMGRAVRPHQVIVLVGNPPHACHANMHLVAMSARQ